MKLIFMGTPDFAVPIFRALMSEHEVALAVTQPDRPKGRGHAMQFTPVKALALEAGVPVLQPETLRDKLVFDELAAVDAEAVVVAAFGLKLPVKILNLPPLGCINVHASLLPRYRGAAPMQYALLNGDNATGITIMHMAKGIDTGDMILQKELPVLPGERLESLHDRMAALGGECILDALTQLKNGTAARIPQDDEAATYASMIQKEDGHIDWNHTTAQVINMTRALDPWPGPFTLYNGETLKIWDGEPAETGAGGLPNEIRDAVPGTLMAVDGTRGFLVRTGDGALWITEVQSVGGRRMKAADYLRGHAMETGVVLG